jgi:hypothetical protein
MKNIHQDCDDVIIMHCVQHKVHYNMGCKCCPLSCLSVALYHVYWYNIVILNKLKKINTIANSFIKFKVKRRRIIFSQKRCMSVAQLHLLFL